MKRTIFVLSIILLFIELKANDKIIVGAQRYTEYINLLKDKNVGMVVNQTSVVDNQHLVDFLLNKKINIKTIFAPEHGFRGNHDAGAHVNNSVDPKTGVPIVSLYGSNKKPKKNQVKDLDVIIFDIQDVGVRFYTYISTMHYVMEACAENNIHLIILDRPNPNGFYVDGPILEKEHKSFVGMHQVPIVHGMTIAEYANMVNNEGWLKNKVKANITFVKNQNYTHKSKYVLPIKPSPNLPNNNSIYFYPSLCFFEGTYVSAGRGTENPFQSYGAPDLKNFSYSFTPKSIKGAASNPKFKTKLCYGEKLNINNTDFFSHPSINLEYLLKAYKNSPRRGDKFFNKFFYKLAGTKKLREQVEAGLNEKEIKKSWEKGLIKFKQIRSKYLLYKDFE
jgi:uncharacterized protein YbbC (DUF1343 family)